MLLGLPPNFTGLLTMAKAGSDRAKLSSRLCFNFERLLHLDLAIPDGGVVS